jgi:hypothetical protein
MGKMVLGQVLSQFRLFHPATFHSDIASYSSVTAPGGVR